MRVFGRQADAATATPLTRAERDERDRKAAQAEARAIAAHERAISQELQARARATVAPVAVEDVRKALLTALDDATAHGAATLRAHMDELALDYEVAPLTVEYQRQADALRRAVSSFRPTPALTARDCDQLAAALHSEVTTIVAALVRRAEDDRNVAATKAGKWLSEWARMARRIPDDDKLADARDDAAFNNATADARPDEATVTDDRMEVFDPATGTVKHVNIFRYPVPREGDYR